MFLYRDEYYNPNSEDKGLAGVHVQEPARRDRHSEIAVRPYQTFTDRSGSMLNKLQFLKAQNLIAPGGTVTCGPCPAGRIPWP